MRPQQRVAPPEPLSHLRRHTRVNNAGLHSGRRAVNGSYHHGRAGDQTCCLGGLRSDFPLDVMCGADWRELIGFHPTRLA